MRPEENQLFPRFILLFAIKDIKKLFYRQVKILCNFPVKYDKIFTMKKVLIINENPLFRDYLRQKLSEEQIEVVLTQEHKDSFTKMITNLPNLIIFDMGIGIPEEHEFLEKKLADPNTNSIPTIITGPIQDRAYIASLAKYGVIKYFEKPIQFDMLLESIGKVLGTPLAMDDSPCVLDLHRNHDVIFVELALGLNREKLALLRYKLSEMIEHENIDIPKIVVMLTNLELSFVDGYNLEFLLDNIISCPRIKNNNVKILSLSPYMRDFIDGHQKYTDIELSTNLPRVLSSLVETGGSSNVSDLITDKILTQPETSYDKNDAVDTRFSSEALNKKTGTVLKIAIIDDNLDTLNEIKNAFVEIGADCVPYTSGQDFLNSWQDENFNLVIHEVLLKDQTGLNVLRALQDEPSAPPVLVYSQGLQREFIIKVLSSGAKSYLVKPQKPQVLVQKALSILGK